MNEEPVTVAVGVIKNEQGWVLISKRPDHVHQGGLWEFPGGKVEQDETIQQALYRELYEELGIEVNAAEPLIKVRHRYAKGEVLLDVWRVRHYSGVPEGREGQQVKWVQQSQFADYAFPAANQPIVKAVRLPDFYAILEGQNEIEVFSNLEKLIDQRIELLQLRLKNLTEPISQQFLEKVLSLCEQNGIALLKNSYLSSASIDDRVGLHLTSQDLHRYQIRPDSRYWVAASCHNQLELAKAEKLQVDFVVLAPVQVTSTHPQAKPLGWETFSQLTKQINLPVFALGGLKLNDLQQAKSAGAQGIAGITTFLNS